MNSLTYPEIDYINLKCALWIFNQQKCERIMDFPLISYKRLILGLSGYDFSSL